MIILSCDICLTILIYDIMVNIKSHDFYTVFDDKKQLFKVSSLFDSLDESEDIVKDLMDSGTGERPVSSQTDTHIVIGRRDSTVTADSVGVNKTRNDIKDLDNKIDIKSKDVDDKKGSRWPIAWIVAGISMILLVLVYILNRIKIL